MFKKLLCFVFGFGNGFDKKVSSGPCEKKGIKELDEVSKNKLFDLISGLGRELRFKAAMRFPEPRRTKELAKILEEDISTGYLGYPQETVSFFERELTIEELKRILKVQKTKKFHVNAIETACLFAEPQRTEELKEILELSKTRGDLEAFLSVKVCLGCSYTTDELEDLLRNQEANEWYSNIPKTMELFPEPLRTEKLKKYHEGQLESRDFYVVQAALKFLNLELTVGRLEGFLKKYIEEGDWNKVEEVKKYLDREYKVEELERLLEKLITLKNNHQAHEVIELIGRRFTFNELERLYGDRFAVRSDCSIKRLEEMLGREMTIVELINVLERQLKDFSRSEAMGTARRILDMTE